MNQKQAITQAVFAGKTLTTLEAVEMFGTVKLPNRIAEIEQKYGIILDRKPVKFKTRYGTAGVYLKYKLDRKRWQSAIEDYKSECKKNSKKVA